MDLRGGIFDPSLSQTIFSDGSAAIRFRYGKDLKVVEAKECDDFPEEVSNSLKMPIDKSKIRQPALVVSVPESDNGYFWMDGRKVFEAGTNTVSSVVREVAQKARIYDNPILIPHQGSYHMVEGLVR